MLDRDLAELYGVKALALRQQVIRNIARSRAKEHSRSTSPCAPSDHQDLLRKIQDMELRYDDQFREVFDAIRALTEPPEVPIRPIGFVQAG